MGRKNKCFFQKKEKKQVWQTWSRDSYAKLQKSISFKQ